LPAEKHEEVVVLAPPLLKSAKLMLRARLLEASMDEAESESCIGVLMPLLRDCCSTETGLSMDADVEAPGVVPQEVTQPAPQGAPRGALLSLVVEAPARAGAG
jgi:hypothetical protein